MAAASGTFEVTGRTASTTSPLHPVRALGGLADAAEERTACRPCSPAAPPAPRAPPSRRPARRGQRRVHELGQERVVGRPGVALDRGEQVFGRAGRVAEALPAAGAPGLCRSSRRRAGVGGLLEQEPHRLRRASDHDPGLERRCASACSPRSVACGASAASARRGQEVLRRAPPISQGPRRQTRPARRAPGRRVIGSPVRAICSPSATAAADASPAHARAAHRSAWGAGSSAASAAHRSSAARALRRSPSASAARATIRAATTRSAAGPPTSRNRSRVAHASAGRRAASWSAPSAKRAGP